MSPHGTVLIPVRNGAGLVSAAIESALRALDGNWQILVSDNNSDDGTALEIAGLDSPLLSSIHWGVSHPAIEHWSLALKHVQTAYVCILGHDDEFSSDFLICSTRALREDPGRDGYLPTVLNRTSDGKTCLAIRSWDFLKFSQLHGIRRFPYFRRAFPAVNCIYGVWSTKFLSEIFDEASTALSLTNPMSDRAIAARLLATGQIAALPSGHVFKAITASSMTYSRVREEVVAYHQIVSATSRSHPWTTRVLDQCSGLLMTATALFVSIAAAITRPVRGLLK